MPSISDQYILNTSLILHFDGANGSSVFTDTSITPKTVLLTGSPTISTTQSIFGGTSGSLDGNNYIYVPTCEDLTFHSGDFCIEFGIWFNNVSGNQGVLGKYGPASYGPFCFYLSGGNLGFSASSTGGGWDISSSTLIITPVINTWYRICVDRNGTNIRIFCNGTLITTITGISAALWNDTNPLVIGSYRYGGYNYAGGYFDEIRITKHSRRTATYVLDTSAFSDQSPQISGSVAESSAITNWRIMATDCSTGAVVGSTTTSEGGTTYNVSCATLNPCNVTCSPKIDYSWVAGITATTGDYVISSNPETTPHIWKCTLNTGDILYGNLALLLHFNGDFNDVSNAPKTVTAVGGATTSALQYLFGTESALFNGTSSYLTIPHSTDFDFGTGDFAVELAFRPSNINNAYQILFDRQDGSTVDLAIQLRINSSNKIEAILRGQGTSTVYTITGTTTLVNNTWYNCALDCVSNVFTLRLNGVSEGTPITQTLNFSNAIGLYIGALYDGSTLFYGNIDEIRITKGVARHTTNYTPYASEFPNSYKTGSVEPTWNLLGNTTDNNITWTYVAPLTDPISIGPKLPG